MKSIDTDTEVDIIKSPAADSAPVESVTADSQDAAGREQAEDTRTPAHMFVGIDGAARSAGVAVLIVTPGDTLVLTFPIDTQGRVFYTDLYALVKEIVELNLNVLAVNITVEAPPPGRFAHQIGRSVNFASGKIVGTLGTLLSSIAVPVPREVLFVAPVQWRKAVLKHKTRTYDKSVAREYAKKILKPAIVETKTDDEVEALCIAMYGMQQVFAELDTDFRKVH